MTDIRSLIAVLDIGETWRDSALCAEVDAALFFPEKGEPNRDAKRICMSCGVRDECLQDALDHDDRHGIRGGLSAQERKPLMHRKAMTGRDEQDTQAA